MEPINKAVYLLFLRHPEGFLFKHLPDYRKELSEIYQTIKPQGLNERALKSIEDVTNPLLNSISEKCARIRSAFINELDDGLALNTLTVILPINKNYIPDGNESNRY